MAWVRYTHAKVSRTNPSALGNCDRCDFTYNRRDLTWQFDWRGTKMQNLRILVCPSCLDAPQQNGQRTILIPPDPVPINNPRVDAHQIISYSSTPDGYFSGQPNVLTTISTISSTGAGNWLTTESTIPLITEIAVTPTPTSSGYSDG